MSAPRHDVMSRSPFVRRVARAARRTRLLESGDRILVAVSGGPDSVALLSVLEALGPSWRFGLWAVHFNYGLRGHESDEDARFVAEFCARKNVAFIGESLDLQRGESGKRRSLQEAARDARYRAMLRIGASLAATKIALGHTADDQAETQVMWMLRGSGPAGLSGMPPMRESLFVRPLLGVSRADVLAYLEEQRLSFRIDSSNAKPLYARNRIRHDLLPVLKRFNPSVVKVLSRQAGILREENDCLEQMAAEHIRRLASHGGQGERIVDRDGLIALPIALQRRMIRALIRDTSGLRQGPRFTTVEAVLSRILHGRSGSSLVVQGCRVIREYDRLRFRAAHVAESIPLLECTPVELCLPVPSTRRWPLTGQTIQTQVVSSEPGGMPVGAPMSAVVDADRLTMPLMVRNWKPGDVFHPFGMGGHRKKLQDYFSDMKLPRHERSRIPLVVAPEGIVWVCGHRTDDRFRPTPATKRRLLITLIDAEA